MSTTKKEFQDNYWEQAQERLSLKNRPLISYEAINYELKNIKNTIGREILVHVNHTKKDILELEETTIGKQQVNQLYVRIEEMLDKQLELYKAESLVFAKKIQNLIKESSNLGSIEEFFENEIWNLDQIEEFIDHFEVNMHASYHLMKKLDKETQQLNLRVLESFLEREAQDENSAYIKLSRAIKVGALLEGYRLKIQLLELNKNLLLKSNISGNNKQEEEKMFKKEMTEFKQEFIRIEKIYKQHRNLWLRSSAVFGTVEFYTEEFYNESDKITSGIVEGWKELLGESAVKLPESYAKASKDKSKRVKLKESASYNDFSAWLVIIHTMIYMLIYYGNAPTSASYSKALGFPESLTGVVQAASPFAALLSNFHFSSAINKGYKPGYHVSFVTMIIGTFLYYISKTFNSVVLLIIGRMVLGYSGGRVITRNFVGTKVKLKYRSLWSSYLVAFTAFSTTLGPGISSFLEYIPEMDILGTEFRSYNAFTFFFFIVVVVFCIFFYATFTDRLGSPSNNKMKERARKRKVVEKKDHKETDGEALQVGSEFTKKSVESFHYSEIDFLEKKGEKKPTSDPTFKGLRVLKHTRIVKQYFPVYFTVLVFTINKMIQESIIAELPLTVKLFYSYSSQDSGFIFLAFTPFTLTMSLLPGYLAQVKNFKNRNMMLFFSICLFLCLLLKININYDTAPNIWYYVIVTCMTLSFTLAAEVSMTAMLGEIAPYYIVLSYCNAGLLSGLGDTGGRSLGNSAVSFFNSIDGIKALTFWMYCVWALFVLGLVLVTCIKLKSLRIIWRAKVDLKMFGNKGLEGKEKLEGEQPKPVSNDKL